MGFFPLLMELERRDCLVVGGGEIARRKVLGLLECGARVTVVAPAIGDELIDLDGVTAHRRSFAESDVQNMALVIASTDDEEVNRAVAQACRARSIPVNVVDVPPLCDFIVPSVIRRGDFIVALSTGGAAPSLSRKLREQLEEEFPENYGPFVAKLREVRTRVLDTVADPEARRQLFERLTEPDVMARLADGGMAAVGPYIDRLVTEILVEG